MSLDKRRLKNSAVAAVLGFLITSLLFLFMPLSYDALRNKIDEAIVGKEKGKARIASVASNSKKQRQKKMLKQERAAQPSRAASASSMFALDLSTMSEGGAGDGVAAGDGVIDENDADTPPIKRFTVPPEYPARARNAGVEGVVVARLLIGEDGRVEQVIILESPKNYGFEKAVTNALMRWKFEPAKLDNMPVRVWARQEIRFSL